MPDNLIIAPDGLVKVEPHVACSADGWRYAKTRRVACIAIGRTSPEQRRNGNATPKACARV